MPRFIPLGTFSDFYTSVSELLNKENFDQFRQKLDSLEAKNLSASAGISAGEFENFLKSLEDPGSILFYDWVEANLTLKSALRGDVGKQRFVDNKGILKHQYFSDFKSFISPYITEVLIGSSSQNDEERSNAMSYIVLLDDEHKILVEDQYFIPIKERLTTIEKEAKEFENEQELVDAVKPLCSDEIIDMVNSLSKSSYASKLYYVDTLLGVIRTKACTARFANWILKQMERVKLNKEHEYKITDFRADLKEGRLSVRNQGGDQKMLRKRDMVTWSIFLILGVGIFYLIYFQPFNEPNKETFEKNSSFKQFSKEERMHLDSLIRTMNTSKGEDGMVIDPGFSTVNTGPTLTIRKEFDNELMEAIYSDLSKDARIQLNHIDSCNTAKSSFVRYEGVLDLTTRNAKVASIFRNNSDYDAILYVAENKSGGAVYSVQIKMNEEVEVKLKAGDVLTLVYGKHFTKYTAPSNTGGSVLPSSRLKYHFCDTDVNYDESINMSFSYEDKTRTTAKFMISGSKGTYVELIDVYDVLDDFGS